MQRKIVSCVLLVFLSLSNGCYNNQTITRDQLNPATKDELNAGVEQRDIAVFTKDSLEFRFLKGNYRIQSDTLKGFGVQTIGGEEKPFQGLIFLADIASLETEEFNLTNTIIAIVVPVGILAGLFTAWAAAMSKI